MKNNLLPFPSLMPAPKDPPRVTGWHVLGTLAVLGVGLGLLVMTLWALFM